MELYLEYPRFVEKVNVPDFVGPFERGALATLGIRTVETYGSFAELEPILCEMARPCKNFGRGLSIPSPEGFGV